MASVKTAFDQKSLIIANILSAGETINHTWSADELYQIIITKGSVNLNGEAYSAITVKDVLPGNSLLATANTNASFLILLRADNETLINQILPPDSINYYEFMQEHLPDWHSQGLPDSPPPTISDEGGSKTISSADLKTMILEGWV